jgi:hypothetical protein
MAYSVLGGDEEARTPDLDSAIVALSQLSYIPNESYDSIVGEGCKECFLFELLTSDIWYKPKMHHPLPPCCEIESGDLLLFFCTSAPDPR